MFKVLKDPLSHFTNLMSDGAGYRSFHILWQKCLLLNDARAIEHVFQTNASNYRKSKFHKGLRPLLGNGIFLSEGDAWFKQRKETAPFFSGKHLRIYADDMVASANEMAKRIETAAQNGAGVDIQAESMWFTLDVVLRALFRDPHNDVAEEMRTSLGILLHDAENRIWNILNVPQWYKRNVCKEYKTSLAFLDSMVTRLVRKKTDNAGYESDFVNTLARHYADSDPLQQQTLRDQVLSFLLAGHETSANVLSWAFLILAQNPDLKARALNEIETVLGDQPLDYDTAQKLPYLLALFEETLRLYPPVWTMSRESLAADSIPTETGESIPVEKGALLMLSPYVTHRRQKYWPDPERFEPERFMGEKREQIDKYAYIPYGGGVRLCLGHKFANIEGVIALATILKHFDFVHAGGTQPKPEPLITLRPDIPVWLSFRPRTKEGLVVPYPENLKPEKATGHICPYAAA